MTSTERLAGEVVLRPADAADLPAVAELYLTVRAAAVPAMPPQIHTPDEVHAYVEGWDLDQRQVWLGCLDGEVVAFSVLHHDWLDSLYVAPEVQRHGLGAALLDVAKSQRPGGLCLWVFESNAPARAFYSRHGCVELERTDGSGNEEKAPDLRLAWPGDDPLRFLRGLIDDLDAELGDLLARRAALTRAVQATKGAGGRDPEREAEIVRALAHRAPALGPERLARILDAVITTSLEAAAEPG